MYSRVGFLYHQEREKEKERERESPKALCSSVPVVCSLRFFSFLFFPNSFFSFVCWMFLEEDGRICQRYFSLFFFFFFFKSLLFPHKRKRAAAHYYYPKKSFEANGARGRLDEGSLNDTAGGLSRLLRRRRRLFFFPRRCFECFLEGLPRVVHTIFGRSRSNFWREVIV